MNKKTFNFELKDTMSPEEVIIESGKKIAECTNDMVICNVDVYEGKQNHMLKKITFGLRQKLLIKSKKL